MTSFRLLSAALLLAASTTAALSGASSVPTNYQPDPALKRASRGELEARVRKACTVTQAKLQNVSEPSLAGPCACYATRTIRSLDPAELQAYRDSGVFNDAARAKAIASLDACRLQRPV
jgi:hypothetical protein